jgi:hypothetical protein
MIKSPGDKRTERAAAYAQWTDGAETELTYLEQT